MTPLPRESALVARLLEDAERKAAEGCRHEAVLLLRWASRVAPEADVPAVLLTYHRIRSPRTPVPAMASEDGSPTTAHDGREGARPGLTTDALGFPVLRYPRQAPTLDLDAFVPAPRMGDRPSRDRTLNAKSGDASSRGRPRKRAGLAVLITLLAGGLILAEGSVPWDAEREERAGGRSLQAAEAALADGNPRRALALAGDRSEDPAVLLVRGRALLDLGDSLDAATALVRVAAHPAVVARQAEEAGILLAAQPGREHEAADAFVVAISAGLPTNRWPAAIKALERAGRHDQAARLTELAARTKRSSARSD